MSAELWPNYQPNQRATSGKHLKSMVVQLACHSDVSAADAIHHCTIPGVLSQRHGGFLQIDRFSMDEWWEVCVLKMKPNVNLTSGRQKPCFGCGIWDVSAPFLPSYFTRAPSCCFRTGFTKSMASSKSASDDLMQLSLQYASHMFLRFLACFLLATTKSIFPTICNEWYKHSRSYYIQMYIYTPCIIIIIIYILLYITVCIEARTARQPFFFTAARGQDRVEKNGVWLNLKAAHLTKKHECSFKVTCTCETCCRQDQHGFTLARLNIHDTITAHGRR